MRTHNIPFFNIKKKITLMVLNLKPRDIFIGTQARVRNSHVNEPSVFKPLKIYCMFPL